jgi:hypothetical protein
MPLVAGFDLTSRPTHYCHFHVLTKGASEGLQFLAFPKNQQIDVFSGIGLIFL